MYFRMAIINTKGASILSGSEERSVCKNRFCGSTWAPHVELNYAWKINSKIIAGNTKFSGLTTFL